MIKRDLGELYSVTKDLDLGNTKFKYFIGKNKKTLLDELTIIESILVQSDGIKEYETKRIEICKELANKDENGEIIMKDNNFDISDIEEFNKRLNPIMEEYKEVFEEQNKKMEDYNNLLNEDSEIELLKISIDNIPDELEQKVLDLLIKLDLIKED